MAKNLTGKLAELARRTERCKDLSEIADYFHDEVATDALMEASRPIKSGRLRDIVEATVRHVRGPEARLGSVSIWRARRTDFVHGAGWSNGDIVAFFLFEKLERGLAIISPAGRAGATHLLRLSVFACPTDVVRSGSRPRDLH